MHACPHDYGKSTSKRALENNGPETMSEQTARPSANVPAGAKLINHYKPVGIAALNAAALCCKNSGKKTNKGK